MKFRKKPVVVDAEKIAELIEGFTKHWKTLPDWVEQAYNQGKLVVAHDAIFVKTLEGNMRGERDDWLVRGTQGELYPCKPGPFADSYEPA